MDEIIKVLRKVGWQKNSNHTFFPTMGGLDLQDAKESLEEDCIEFICSLTYIIKPKKLTFESFQDPIWNYFRLETADIEKSGVFDDPGHSEELAELTPLNYVSREYWDEQRYNDEPLPSTARLVIRKLKGGSFVIFSKQSWYNKQSSTYDARHNKMNETEFRKYIEGVIENGWEG
ncbi:serine/threonine protein kinase [Maribacter sp. 6B07]|nr:serine/threonine protein kinase [Maribacter sp. 6B07]